MQSNGRQQPTVSDCVCYTVRGGEVCSPTVDNNPRLVTVCVTQFEVERCAVQRSTTTHG